MDILGSQPLCTVSKPCEGLEILKAVHWRQESLSAVSSWGRASFCENALAFLPLGKGSKRDYSRNLLISHVMVDLFTLKLGLFDIKGESARMDKPFQGFLFIYFSYICGQEISYSQVSEETQVFYSGS